MIRRPLPVLTGFIIVVLLTALRITDPYPVQVLREIGFDSYQRLHPRQQPDLPVRVIDIDESSLSEIGQWPWPRDRLATIADRLGELGAAAIGFDLLAPEPDRMSPQRLALHLPGVDPDTLPDYDATFAEALGRTPSIMGFARAPDGPPLTGTPKGGIAISGTDPRQALPYLTGVAAPLPILRDAAPGFASLSLNTELSSSVIRRLPMLWTNGTDMFPSLSIEALRIAFGLSGIVVLGDTSDAGYLDGLRVGDITIPTTSRGDLWLYYSHPDPTLRISARDLLGDQYRALRDRIEGHIVLVGTSAAGLLDINTTTLGDNVPGVTIHAQALEQILSGDFLSRPDWVQGLEWFEFFLLGMLMVFVVLTLGPFAGLVAGAAALAFAGGVSYWMFLGHGLMLDASFPLIGLTLIYLALVFLRFLTTDAAQKQIRQAFGYYVAPSLLAEIEKNGNRLKLGGETRQVTVMFTDMRGFTSLSERLEPQQILTILNTLFGALGAEIIGRLGTIDKFIGDAIMAFWNAPVDVEGHEQKALEAALGMRKRLAELNANDAFNLRGEGADSERLNLGIGIGLSTGDALVGNMGLESRFDYSALGDTVNIASRIEGACKDVGYDIIVADPLRRAVPHFAMLEAGSLPVKGKSARVTIHILVGDASLAQTGAFKLLRQSHSDALTALRDGADARGAIAECTALGISIEPGLKTFYEQLAQRAGDFRVNQIAAE